MITIHPMPTRIRPLPELEIYLDAPRLRKLAGVLDRVKVDSNWHAGLCVAVRSDAFERAVSRAMNKDISTLDRHYRYLYQYLGELTLEELTAIRQAWAKHIARSIYEQIGA